jgi:hypothetical protein
MKLLIQKTYSNTSNIVRLEMLSTEFNTVIKTIKENEIPVIVFTDTDEFFLINNINELIVNSKTTTDVILNILNDDLISLGSSASNSISKSVGDTYTTNAIITLTQAEYDAITTKDDETLYFIV